MDSRLQLPANTILDAGYRIVRVVGTGGFGITYEAADINLATQVAIKEYYPFDFGDRDATMSVKPKSERHRRTFDWGRSNFLQEARTLARFEHPSIVRVTRVFEANSTAYMVMRFEQGQSFEAWLNGLGRLPTQDELDAIVAPLLSALELMHAADFLHRDIAPDNIIVRADGSPVLLDFGAARRAVAAMSRSLTGIVKAGYSPHEQYSADSRLQGPWSDLYALSATLYRAVMGRPPDEVALRIDEDHMEPASHAAKKGRYRPGFLHAIDACLKVRYLDRPQSVAQLRPMLMANTPMAKREAEPSSKPRQPVSAPPPSRKVAEPARPRSGRRNKRLWWSIAAMVVVASGGVFGGLQYTLWQSEERGRVEVEAKRKAEQEPQREAYSAGLMKKADEEGRARARAETEAKRREDLEEARARAAEAKRRAEEAEAEAIRLAEAEVVEKKAHEERVREEAAAKLKAEEEAKLRADAAAAARKTEEEAKQTTEPENATVIAGVPQGSLEMPPQQSVMDPATLARSLQTELKRVGCDPGPIDGDWGREAREALTRFGRNAKIVLESDTPTQAALQQLLAQKGRVCPLQCGAGQVVSGDRCVARSERAAPKPPKAEVPSRQVAREATTNKSHCRYRRSISGASRTYTCD